MTSQLLLKGMIFGFAIAAPVGPIGVLCIRRSLADGQSAGLATGLGAATADALYGCVAAFGLTAVSEFLVKQRFWLGLIGGLFLCYLGLRTLFTRSADKPTAQLRTGLAGAYLSTFALTITNPMTILSFVAVFASLGLVGSSNYFAATALVVGVFVGSALWWLLLSAGSALLRNRIGPSVMLVVNRGSGVLIFALGLYALASVLRSA
jgi:threonine/homoserine/homoserine lactone efflux protein